MKLRTLISPLALAAALAFSGSAMAQTMVGGVEVSAQDMAKVQEKCAAIAAAATQSAAGDQATDAKDSGDSAQDNAADPSAKSNVEGLLGTLTAEQCAEAKMMPMDNAMAASDTSAAATTEMMLTKDDPDVVAACAALAADKTQSAAGDQATDMNTNDASAQSTPADPSSKHAEMVAGLDAKACADMGL